MSSLIPSDSALEAHIPLLCQLVTAAPDLYAQLVLIVGPARSGKTRLLRAFALSIGASSVNVSLELSRQLLAEDRALVSLRISSLFAEIVGRTVGDIVLLDNIELLFAQALAVEPLTLLQRNARSRTLVATWSGQIRNSILTYAEPGHPEYRKYPASGILLVDLSPATATDYQVSESQ